MFENERNTPDDVARTGVKRVVFDVLRAQHGAGSVVQRPISPRIDIPHPVPADYAAGITAARKVAGHARRLLREYADAARGDGRTWRELAEPLGIEMDEDGYTDVAVEAFLAVCPEPLRQFDRRRTSWRCASCGEVVTDYGPYNGNPVDDESGHAEDCVRHQAEIAACRARNA